MLNKALEVEAAVIMLEIDTKTSKTAKAAKQEEKKTTITVGSS
ncbi:hypothetical protein AGMMS50233_07150 [Endomicrobiia bacterium]|nr:hypothetical protein AGMMS50233_07150 [Endomicrobiia bacterium]